MNSIVTYLSKRASGRIFRNIFWLFLDKALRMGFGLVVGIWVARYLGPDQFGKLSYAQAFVAIFGTIVNLGLDTLLVKDLVDKRHSENTLIGTGFALRLVGSLLAILLTGSLAWFTDFDKDSVTFLLIVITSSTLVAQAFDVIDIYFQAHLKSKVSVLLKNAAFVLASGYKVFLLVNHFPLLYFAFAIVLELFLGALFLVFYANQKLPIKVMRWRWDKRVAVSLLQNGWPLIVSAVSVMLYMRMDQLMIRQLLDTEAVGNYTAAVRITEIWFFVPMVVCNSVFPSLVTAFRDAATYKSKLLHLYATMLVLSISLSVLVALGSGLVIAELYGPQYAAAADVLVIHVWSSIFVFLGVASSQQLVVEGKNKVSLYRTLAGLFSNLLLNLALIPAMGIRGAAFATLISYSISGVFSNLLFKSTRHVFFLILEAFRFKKAFKL